MSCNTRRLFPERVMLANQAITVPWYSKLQGIIVPLISSPSAGILLFDVLKIPRNLGGSSIPFNGKTLFGEVNSSPQGLPYLPARPPLRWPDSHPPVFSTPPAPHLGGSSICSGSAVPVHWLGACCPGHCPFLPAVFLPPVSCLPPFHKLPLVSIGPPEFSYSKAFPKVSPVFWIPVALKMEKPCFALSSSSSVSSRKGVPPPCPAWDVRSLRACIISRHQRSP